MHTAPSPILHAIGTAVPAHRISQKAHEDLLLAAADDDRVQKLMLRKIYAGSGIEYRHSVLGEYGTADAGSHQLFRPQNDAPLAPLSTRMNLYEEYAQPLLEDAVKACFAKLKDFEPTTITHIITFSCTGLYAPGPDIGLINAFGLAKDIERTCINFMGCYAAINALKTAAHICRSEPEAVVLIAGIELCSLHYRRSADAEQLVANAIFSDGAAAGIISAQNISRSGDGVALELRQFYAAFENEGAEDMVWRVGDYGFELRLSSDVPARVESGIHALVSQLMQKAGLTVNDIKHWAVHPGGIRILKACEAALGLAAEQNANSYDVLRNYGNMSSVTILFVLERYMQQLRESGEPIVACAFGPGLTMESLLAISQR